MDEIKYDTRKKRLTPHLKKFTETYFSLVQNLEDGADILRDPDIAKHFFCVEPKDEYCLRKEDVHRKTGEKSSVSYTDITLYRDGKPVEFSHTINKYPYYDMECVDKPDVYVTKRIFDIFKKKVKVDLYRAAFASGNVKEFLSEYDSRCTYAVKKTEREQRIESPSIIDYANIPFTAAGVWMAYLLYITPNIFGRFSVIRGHGHSYGGETYVMDLDELRRHLEDEDANVTEDFFPIVGFVNNDEMELRFSHFDGDEGDGYTIYRVNRNFEFRKVAEYSFAYILKYGIPPIED